MHILLVNDDGFDSPFLPPLCQAAARRGHRVSVAAPRTQQSAKSHSFTVFEPLTVSPAHMDGAAEAWRIDGTPADCARLGFMALSEQPVDLVISGINQGYNAGLATYVSGTVGAAREAAFAGYKAMAVSADPSADAENLALLADYAIRTGEKLMTYPAPPRAVCNLNMPPLPRERMKPTVVAPISPDMYRDSYDRRVSPRGMLYFWLGPETPAASYTPHTDLWYLHEGHPTVTFLTPEPCDQSRFSDFPVEL